VGTRAASEALKGIVYQYLARVEPFSGSDRNANLAEKVSEVERLAADHASLVAGAAPDARAVPHVNGVADYLRKRAEDQRNWHEQRTAKHKACPLLADGRTDRYRSGRRPCGGRRCLAWAEPVRLGRCCHDGRCCVCRPLASQQHDRIADSYARTVLSLNDAIRRFAAESATKEEAAEFVANVEQVLPAQNDAWVGLFSAKSGA
jgi:hypothetical protein